MVYFLIIVSSYSSFCVCVFLRSTVSVLRGHSFCSFPPQRPMTSVTVVK